MGEFWRENQVVTETGKRTYIFVIRLFYQQFITFLIWTNTFKISIWTIQGAFPSNNVMSSTLKMQTRGGDERFQQLQQLPRWETGCQPESFKSEPKREGPWCHPQPTGKETGIECSNALPPDCLHQAVH